jgi:hypothetical protein
MSFAKTSLFLGLTSLICGLAVAGATSYFAPVKKIQPARLQDEIPSSPMAGLHLYPRYAGAGAGDSPDRSYGVLGGGGLDAATYLSNFDDSSKDVLHQDDGPGIVFERAFYPEIDLAKGRKLKSFKIYAADGKTVRGEARFRQEDGSQQYDARLLPDGKYQIFTLFGDGRTAETELLMSEPSPFETDHARKQLRFRRWQENGHILVYDDELNDDGGSRDIKKLDPQGLVILAKHIGLRSIVGTTVTAYFAGTNQIVMQSVSTVSETDAIFFRENGSKKFEQVLSAYGVTVKYFDDTGHDLLFQQEWLTGDPTENPRSQPRLWRVTELNAKGEPTRQLTFRNGILSTQVLYDIEIKGVVFSDVNLDYDEAGKLLFSSVTPRDKKRATPKVEALGLSSISTHVNVKELTPLDVSYELPVPPPTRHERD